MDWRWEYITVLSKNYVKRCDYSYTTYPDHLELTIYANPADFPLVFFAYGKDIDSWKMSRRKKFSLILYSDGSYKRIHRLSDIYDHLRQRYTSTLKEMHKTLKDHELTLSYENYGVKIKAYSEDTDFGFDLEPINPNQEVHYLAPERLILNRSFTARYHKTTLPLFIDLFSEIRGQLENVVMYAYRELNPNIPRDKRLDLENYLYGYRRFEEIYRDRLKIFRLQTYQIRGMLYYLQDVNKNLVKSLDKLVNELYTKVREKWISSDKIREYKKFLRNYGIRGIKNCTQATVEFLKLTDPQFRNCWEVYNALLERLYQELQKPENKPESINLEIEKLNDEIDRRASRLEKVSLELALQFWYEMDRFDVLKPYLRELQPYLFKLPL